MKAFGVGAVLVFALLAFAGPASANEFRLDAVSAVELLNQPSYEGVVGAMSDQANVLPGLKFEIVNGNVGGGGTYLVKFDRSGAATTGYDWYLTWIASADFRYHFLSRFVLDPFIQASFGSAGRVHLEEENAGDPLQLSLFAQVGGGLAFRLRGLNMGVSALYGILNSPIPVTSIEVYPLKAFRVELFAGFTF